MKFGNTSTSADNVQDAIAKRGTQLVNGIEEGIDSAHDAAQNALSNVSDKIEDIQSDVKPAVKRLAARGAELAKSGLDATREASERAKTVASRYASACETYVSEQPLKSVAIAAAAGATLAALLMIARKRSNNRNQYSGRE